MCSEVEHLPEDVYSFWGHQIGIRSNSHEVLSYFKSLYARFCLGKEDTVTDHEQMKMGSQRHVIEAIDNIASSNELLLKDDSDSYRLKCQSLYAFDYDHYHTQGTISDPLGFIAWLFLKNVYLSASDYLLIHAGAVSWKNQAIIFPAPGGMGKTTLTVKLIQSGFRFLSDEIACLHSNRDIVDPFFRKLNINDESRQLLGLPTWSESNVPLLGPEDLEWAIDIEEIVPSSLSNPCPLCYILFLQGFGEKPRLEYLSSSNALFRLFRFSLSPAADPANLLFKLAPTVDRVKCYNLIIGDLEETVEVVLGLVNTYREEQGAVEK